MPVRNNGNPLAVELFCFFKQFSTKLACVYESIFFIKVPLTEKKVISFLNPEKQIKNTSKVKSI